MRDDILLLQQIEELALGGSQAKKQRMMAQLGSSVSFLPTVITLGMAVAGTIALPGVGGLTVMGLFAMMNAKNFKSKSEMAIYKAFFDPHQKLVKEFDKAIGQITNASLKLKAKYKLASRKMFTELSHVPEQPTEKDAILIYRKIYTKHMSAFIKDVKKANLPLTKLQQQRFDKLIKQLQSAKLLAR